MAGNRVGYHTGELRCLLFVVFTIGMLLGQSALENAVTLAREKRYTEARAALQGVAEPTGREQRIAFHRLKAAIASGLGDAANAATEMEAALQLAPADSKLLLAAAVAELQAGKLDLALRHAGAAERSAAQQALIGDIQEKRKAYVEAAKAYQEAVALAPEREDYRIALALEFVQHHTFVPAIAVLEQAAPLFPKSAKIRVLLGIARYANDDREQAVNALMEAIAIDGRLEPAYNYLSRIVLESSVAPRQMVIDKLCSWNRGTCAALEARASRELRDKSRMAKAIEALKQAAADDAVARCELARAYEWMEQLPAARDQMETCVRLSPTALNHYRLGLIYGRLGLTDLSRKEMDLRTKIMAANSQEDERRLNAVEAFQFAVK